MYGQGAKGHQEGLLVDQLDRIRRNPEGRKVVHIRLSQLLAPNRTSVRMRIVGRMFRTLESGRQIQMFPMFNDDLMLVVSPAAQRDVNNICDKIRSLFSTDPVTQTPPAPPCQCRLKGARVSGPMDSPTSVRTPVSRTITTTRGWWSRPTSFRAGWTRRTGGRSTPP